MSNSIYFQLKKDLSKKQIFELKKILQRVNKKMKIMPRVFNVIILEIREIKFIK